MWENQWRLKNFDGVHEIGGGFVKGPENAMNVSEAVLESLLHAIMRNLLCRYLSIHIL